ncbi:DUF188 domain-containing protein [Haloplanus sp. GCM10025708]|uniref:DUF188 domain-containing protein n=1 Tax=Haloferacaceae TaxID=1644056 RepID=UPI003616B237
MDTSALMMPVECGVRVFEEVERLLGESPDWVTPAAVRTELDRLSAGGGTEATAASVGLDLADRCRTVETDASYADDALVDLAERGDCEYVVTNDLPLRDRLLERGVRVIGLRGRNTLHIQER